MEEMPNCFFISLFAVLLILNVIKKQVIDNESNISHPVNTNMFNVYK